MSDQTSANGAVEFLTSDDLAERWCMTRQNVSQMRHRGVLPPGFRIGQRILWRLDDVLEWEASRKDPDADRRSRLEAVEKQYRTRRKVTPQRLNEVAKVYRKYSSSTPTKAVAAALGVGPRMASVYIKRAEEAGLLPATTPGKKRA